MRAKKTKTRFDKAIILTMTAFFSAVVIVLFLLARGGYVQLAFIPQRLPQKLQHNCLEVMGKGSCVIASTTAYLPPQIKQIFISGYGTLNAETYRRLKGEDIFMCQDIQDSCTQDEESEVCRLGKALYASAR